MSTLVAVKCPICTRLFCPRPWDLRAGGGKYCSRACRNRAGGLQGAAARGGLQGASNPNWRGGVSRDKRRYKDRFRARYPEKARAHDELHQAVRRGDIARGPCADCGRTHDVHAHHTDYSRPLAVAWLCRGCHRERHEAALAAAGQLPTTTGS